GARTWIGPPKPGRYLNWNLQRHGVSIEHIRRDRVLYEALTARGRPLHLALVSGLSQAAADQCTLIARDLLADEPAGITEPGELRGKVCHTAARGCRPLHCTGPGLSLCVALGARTGAAVGAAHGSLRQILPIVTPTA